MSKELSKYLFITLEEWFYSMDVIEALRSKEEDFPLFNSSSYEEQELLRKEYKNLYCNLPIDYTEFYLFEWLYGVKVLLKYFKFINSKRVLLKTTNRLKKNYPLFKDRIENINTYLLSYKH